jgi:hypothetical protein
MDVVVINIIQIERTIDTTHPIIEPILIHKSSAKNVFDKELEVNLEDKVYFDTYYNRKPCQVQIDETLAKLKV